jgi:general secretion pathway protein H
MRFRRSGSPRCRPRATRAGTHGFTLIELLVCLAVLALVAAVVPPLLGRGRDSAALMEASRTVAAALRETRSEAIANGSAQSFSIDLATGAFRAGAGNVRRLPAGIRLSLVTAANQRLGAQSGAILFFPDGSSTGGGLSLARDAKRLDVLVDWLTGGVRMAARNAAAGS